MSIEAVALKLQTVWTTCPLAWFVQTEAQSLAWFALTEAQFALHNISSDDTRYFHVVAALDSQTAIRALSVIASPTNMRPLNHFYFRLSGFPKQKRLIRY